MLILEFAIIIELLCLLILIWYLFYMFMYDRTLIYTSFVTFSFLWKKQAADYPIFPRFNIWKMNTGHDYDFSLRYTIFSVQILLNFVIDNNQRQSKLTSMETYSKEKRKFSQNLEAFFHSSKIYYHI